MEATKNSESFPTYRILDCSFSISNEDNHRLLVVMSSLNVNYNIISVFLLILINSFASMTLGAHSAHTGSEFKVRAWLIVILTQRRVV